MSTTTCPHCQQETASLLPWPQRVAIGLTAGVVLLAAGAALTLVGLWPAILVAPVAALALALWPIRRCTSCSRLSF